MKLNQLPLDVKNAILQSAMRVMSESTDMAHMLQKADLLLKHDFPSTPYMDSIVDLEERLAKAKWIKEFSDTFEEFWTATKYPKRHWRSTLSDELSGWLCEDWKTTDGKSAAKSNISYWEN